MTGGPNDKREPTVKPVSQRCRFPTYIMYTHKIIHKISDVNNKKNLLTLRRRLIIFIYLIVTFQVHSFRRRIECIRSYKKRQEFDFGARSYYIIEKPIPLNFGGMPDQVRHDDWGNMCNI